MTGFKLMAFGRPSIIDLPFWSDWLVGWSVVMDCRLAVAGCGPSAFYLYAWG
jgi:hypothetical protein